MIPKAKLPRIVQSVLRWVWSACSRLSVCVLTFMDSGLVTPESETVANNVVLVGHGIQAIMQRLEDMKISKSIHFACLPPRVSV